MKQGTSFNLARLRKLVRPYRLHFFPQLRGTNDHASEMRHRGELFAPAIVLTGNQFKGRGRGANAWWSGPGSITATFVMPVHDGILPHQVPLLAGLAVRNAVAEFTGDASIELKWPNDLLYGTRKLAGLLCERTDRVDLIGLGMNVNLTVADAPSNLRTRITSLSQIVGHAIDKTDVLAAIVRHLHPMLSRRDDFPFVAALKQYDRHHVLRGRRVTIGEGANGSHVTGTCQGLDALGRLLVRANGQVTHVAAGHVEMR